MKKLALAALLLPLATFAQGAGPGPGAGPQGGPPGARPDDQRRMEKMERKMRLARTLGLAEALDLEPQKALELGAALEKQDEKRTAIRKQMREAHDVLRRAADGEKVTPAEVDQAIQKGLDARTQMAQLDRDSIASVTKGLGPEQKARAVLFLDRFQRRFAGPGFGPGQGDVHRMMRKRMGPGGPGAGGPGAGLEMMKRDRALAFAFAGPEGERRVMAFGSGGDAAFEWDEDLPFDDAFDVEVEVEEP